MLTSGETPRIRELLIWALEEGPQRVGWWHFKLRLSSASCTIVQGTHGERVCESRPVWSAL